MRPRLPSAPLPLLLPPRRVVLSSMLPRTPQARAADAAKDAAKDAAGKAADAAKDAAGKAAEAMKKP